jgi:hypothetical protein
MASRRFGAAVPAVLASLVMLLGSIPATARADEGSPDEGRRSVAFGVGAASGYADLFVAPDGGPAVGMFGDCGITSRTGLLGGGSLAFLARFGPRSAFEVGVQLELVMHPQGRCMTRSFYPVRTVELLEDSYGTAVLGARAGWIF